MDQRIHRVVTDDLFQIGQRVRQIDPFLTLVYNHANNRYEIHDTHPKVHPSHTLLMRIQKENGDARTPDSRDISTLLEMRSKSPEQVWNELEQYEEARQRKWDAENTRLGLALASDLRWVGIQLGQSVLSRARSLAYRDRAKANLRRAL